MQSKYVIPEYLLKAFNCPRCGAYATQEWLTSAWLRGRGRRIDGSVIVKDIAISVCQLCGESCVWVEDLNSLQAIPHYIEGALPPPSGFEVPKEPTKGMLVYPVTSLAPMPTEDMPAEIKSDYMEAREIVNLSPRGAAALLRLCVQKLMPVLGEKGCEINNDISELVKKGLPIEAQQALDSLRVIGNEAVHPGTIDLSDDRETAIALFDLLNFIVERMITQKIKIGEIYSKLPSKKLDAIAKRDKKS